jgi:hypothetical protein
LDFYLTDDPRELALLTCGVPRDRATYRWRSSTTGNPQYPYSRGIRQTLLCDC